MLTFIAKSNGTWTYEYRGTKYSFGRTSYGRDWEIAVWTVGGWLLCSGQVPEGTFKTLREAKEALLEHIGAYK